MASKILRKEISSGSSLKFNWDGKSDNLDIIIQKKQTTNYYLNSKILFKAKLF